MRVVVRLRGHRPARRRRRRRGWPRTSASCAPAAGAWWASTPRSPARDETLDAARRPGRRPRCRRPHPRGRGRSSTSTPAPGSTASPTTTGCSSTASTSTAACPARSPTTPVEHEQRRRLRPPTGRPNPVVLGTDGIGADMLEEFRLAYVGAAGDDVPASPDTAWSWLEAAGALVPEAARRPGRRGTTTTPTAPWHAGLHPRRPSARGRSVDGEVAAAPTVGPPGSTSPRCAPRPPSRPPASSPASDAAADSPSPLGRGSPHPMAAARRPLPAGRPPDPRGHGASPGTPRRRASTRSGRPRAGWCARPPCRWPRSPRSPTRIKVGSGVVDCWTRNPARLAATFSTLDDLAPGRVILGIGAWWDPLAAKVGIDRARPLDGHARDRHRRAGAAAQRDRDLRRRPTCTSTASSSTTCTRSAGPRTCRSTSGPPACR